MRTKCPCCVELYKIQLISKDIDHFRPMYARYVYYLVPFCNMKTIQEYDYDCYMSQINTSISYVQA